MNPRDLRALLEEVAAGRLAIDEAQERLVELPFSDLGFAKLDLHREVRAGHPEAVYAEGKTIADLERIVDRFLERTGRVLLTRVDDEKASFLTARFPQGSFHERARIWSVGGTDPVGDGVAVVAAGTSDLAVADEAAVVLQWLGHPVERVYDVGVAGVHRLIAQLPVLRRCRAVVAVAGMDGALPTLIGGLVATPVVAVPTSVGYGAAFGGLAPLLTMLNACAPGVAVVNIDNGYGAAVMAARIVGFRPETVETGEV